MRRAHHKLYFVTIFLCCVSINSVAKINNVETSINIETITGYGFQLKDVALKLDSSLNNSSYSIQIGSVKLPEGYGDIEGIILQCRSGIISKLEIACDDGELSFSDSLVSAKKAKLKFSRKESGNLHFKLDEFSLAGGTATLDAEMNADGWLATLSSDGISLAELQDQLPAFPKIISSGSVKSTIKLSGKHNSLTSIDGNMLLRNISFSNEESTIVGENAAYSLTFISQRDGDTWRTKLDSTVFNGQLYFDPIFIDANENSKDLFGNINWEIGSKQVELSDFNFEDQNSMHVGFTTIIDYEKKEIISPIQAKINYALFPKVYDFYIQPFLLETNAANLATKGRLSGHVLIDNFKVTQGSLSLNNLSLADNQKRFSVTNLNGDVGWGEIYTNQNYSLSFDLVELYKLKLGSSSFSFVNHGQSLELSKSVEVPLFDGSINIESFEINQPGKNDQFATMDISLTPVSMAKLSTALGWPEMNGNLAGYAPKVLYKKGDIEVGGALLVRGFGGTTTIHNLKANDIFGITPKLYADIQLNNLDLSSLTETFSFGEITGRVSGMINDLEFVSWAPVKFDAWFGTPENDNSRHRISQTAVDNLTQVGNGASNVLSKSFLKFFDSFGYDKLGLGCSLNNNICKMRGVEEFGTSNQQGFYIVKGSGIPRIDIVGFTEEVSWSVLTARLKRVISTKEVIVN